MLVFDYQTRTELLNVTKYRNVKTRFLRCMKSRQCALSLFLRARPSVRYFFFGRKSSFTGLFDQLFNQARTWLKRLKTIRSLRQVFSWDFFIGMVWSHKCRNLVFRLEDSNIRWQKINFISILFYLHWATNWICPFSPAPMHSNVFIYNLA